MIKIKRYIIKIVSSKSKGFNYDYIFIGKRIYIEREINRYLRIIDFLKKYNDSLDII